MGLPISGIKEKSLHTLRSSKFVSDMHYGDGAGDGNRTRVTALEGRCSAIELHLRLADHTGFEPVISSVTGKHVRPLHQWSVRRLIYHKRATGQRPFGIIGGGKWGQGLYERNEINRHIGDFALFLDLPLIAKHVGAADAMALLFGEPREGAQIPFLGSRPHLDWAKRTAFLALD